MLRNSKTHHTNWWLHQHTQTSVHLSVKEMSDRLKMHGMKNIKKYIQTLFCDTVVRRTVTSRPDRFTPGGKKNPVPIEYKAVWAPVWTIRRRENPLPLPGFESPDRQARFVNTMLTTLYIHLILFSPCISYISRTRPTRCTVTITKL
jgi:hypothetical protein